MVTIPLLKRRDIAPPGGFIVKAPTGATFESDSFSELQKKLEDHLRANGMLPHDAEKMIDIQNGRRLSNSGHHSYIKQGT